MVIFHFSGNTFYCDMPSASIRHPVMSHPRFILWIIHTPAIKMISFWWDPLVDVPALRSTRWRQTAAGKNRVILLCGNVAAPEGPPMS